MATNESGEGEEDIEDIDEGIDDESGNGEVKYVEVDGKKFVDDGTGKPKLGTDGQPEPYIQQQQAETPEAKAARLLRQTNQARKKAGLEPIGETKVASKQKKSVELDYGQKAYLNSNGIKGKAELEFVQTELKASGEDLDTLIENPYFINRLESFRAINKTKNATIIGKRGGGPAIDSVEYWASKPIEEVPKEMRLKVVNHKIAQEKNQGVFYNSKK